MDADILLNNPSRPSQFEDRYRLYIDESGDHVFQKTDETSHRFLCLLGVWFQNPDYLVFHDQMESLKQKYFHHHPDQPVILHREDIINARKSFKAFQNEEIRQEFDNSLLSIIHNANFSMVAVVIDKASLRTLFGDSAAHPYHLGLGFLLQRYTGFLNHINRIGDVMAETRGKEEDLLLEQSYNRVFEHGIWGITSAASFQSALSSKQIKMRSKSANISGLQLADIFAHPVKTWVLNHYGIIDSNQSLFAQTLLDIGKEKFNSQLYTKKIQGYGYVLYPQK